MARPPVKLAPSVLSADFARMGEQVAEATAAGADYIHVDLMDGHFVPSLTFGPAMVQAIRPHTSAPLDVHMMVSSPERFIGELSAAGAGIVTVHAEACPHLHRVVHLVKDAGLRAGVALNPGTPISSVEEVLPDLDLVLVMTVDPGAGGQPFIRGMLDKVARVRALLDQRGLNAELEVDGGVNADTVVDVARAGADVVVAGSAVFSARMSVADAVARLRHAISTAAPR